METFGDILRHWRKTRRFSQMALALTADVSTRHLSFIETGRAQPSYGLILRLAAVLSLSLRHTNTLLVAAGYAPRYSAWSLEDEQTGVVREALGHMLTQHAPYPAFVTTRSYDILMVNEGTHALLAWLTEGNDFLSRFDNSYRLLFAPDGLRPYIANFDELQQVLLKRLHEESIYYQDTTLFQLYETCAHLAEAPYASDNAHDTQLPVVTLALQKGDVDVHFFSTLTTFGTAVDVTTQELRMEQLFPADEQTQTVVRTFSSEAP